MRLSTEIIRTPFGSSSAFGVASFYGREGWEDLKARFEFRHKETVASQIGAIPRRAKILGDAHGYREEENEQAGDRTGEWWTVVVHDDVPLLADPKGGPK